MSIGANLKRVRTKAGLSQSELAELVGVTQSMIAQVERGTKALTLELGREIAIALNIQIGEFLKEAPDNGYGSERNTA